MVEQACQVREKLFYSLSLDIFFVREKNVLSLPRSWLSEALKLFETHLPVILVYIYDMNQIFLLFCLFSYYS